MEAINLDLLPGAMPPIVHVSQGDVGRQFQISIYDDTGAAYSLTGKTLSIVGHKGDGNVFQYAIPSSAISGNTVTITTEEQMTPAAGKALCEIRIEQSGTKLGTCNFVMDVEQGPADMGSLSISALYLIDALFEQAETDIAAASAAATTATQKASEAAASAASAASSLAQIGDAVDVATAKATAAANSASAAATSETNAASSASTASTAATNASNSATAADTSATAAATSASAASSSASSASTYADAADTSADAAADYASAASQSATAAATSASNASTSETNAASSAITASTSATNAATSESNAATSETNAASSASAASTSATNAADSATAAASSATAAEAAKDEIEDMTVTAESVAYTSPAEVTKSIVQGVVNLDFKIPRGQPTSGHDVEANPSGSATGGDITKLGIDGTVYNISGLPDYSQASQNDVLTIGQSGPEWAAPSGGGGAVIPITPNPSGLIWEIWSGSFYYSPTKLFDRSTDQYFDFVAGNTYYLRLGSSGSKTPFSLTGGQSIFFDSAVGGWIVCAMAPGVSTFDFSSYDQALAALGTQDRVYLIPYRFDLNYDYFSDGKVKFVSGTCVQVRESGDQSGVLYNKCKYMVEVRVECIESFRFAPHSIWAADLGLIAMSGQADHVDSAYVTM
jgi:hypothetical protein